ncbi:V-set and immunoglobulin domain-containing protein 10-like 2 [Scleropages formosus]|uniref:V-set and immunoglobulin domain-containing protein 10-like 2 n=1 Tax=Scleropages formosus TaxID=113540 RepID=UPI0010FAB94C|nr:V-set and immunoglobulin domain-containing protein 10-like 2 [Scleropages formosus]
MRYGLGGFPYFCLIFFLQPSILQGLDILDSGQVVYIELQTKRVVGETVILECGSTVPDVYIWGYTIPGTEHIRAVVFNFGQGPKLQSLAKTLGDLNVITNTASLLIEKLPLAAQGLYTCQALYDTPQGAKLIYYYVQLLVLVPVSKPHLLVDDSSPVEGTPIWMRCSLENGSTPINYKWEHKSSDAEATTTTKVAEGNINRVNITSVNRNHTGWYWCLATNEVNQQRSDGIWLEVLFGPDVPRIDVTPYSVTERGYSAVERTTVSLMCQASSNPPSQYVWFYNNSQVHTGQQYNITKILRMHSGHYSCLAQNYYLNTNSKTTITLYVYYPPNGSPTCTIRPTNNYTDVALWCSWEGGYPPASLYWSSPLITPNGTAPSFTNTTLVHPGSTTPHNSTFTCHGSHVASPASYSCSTTALLPLGEPQCYVHPTRNNEYLILSCSWEGGFPQSLLWWESDDGVTQGNFKESMNILILRSSVTFSGKAFVCHAKHPLALATKLCPLRLEAPVLATQLKVVSVYEGNDVQLSCILKANYPDTEITWFNNHKKQVGDTPSKYLLYREATWSNLTVREADGVQDSGQYWCSASNAVGGAEIPITVLIKRYPVPPNVTISKIKYSSHQRTEVDLQWAVKETGNLTGFIVEGLRTQGSQVKENKTSFWVQMVTSILPDGRYHKLVGLDPTSIYAFRILAINHRTLGYPSEVKSPEDPPFNAYPTIIGAVVSTMVLATVGFMLLFLYIMRIRNGNSRFHHIFFGMQHSLSRENINSPEDEVVSMSQREGPAVVSGGSTSAPEGDTSEPVGVTITATTTT